MPTKTEVLWIVRCEDGHIRHEPFRTFRDADHWANWGHCCTSDHTFEREIR